MNEAGATMDVNNYTNSELEEMGFPPPCECLSTYRDSDEYDNAYDVCVDCGSSRYAGRVREGSSW